MNQDRHIPTNTTTVVVNVAVALLVDIVEYVPVHSLANKKLRLVP
jgi:hypothetical protein